VLKLRLLLGLAGRNTRDAGLHALSGMGQLKEMDEVFRKCSRPVSEYCPGQFFNLDHNFALISALQKDWYAA
jgi:hypothetical protein